MERLDKENPNVKVHKDSRRDFTNPLCKPDLSMGLNNEGESSKSSATLRSAAKECFDWMEIKLFFVWQTFNCRQKTP